MTANDWQDYEIIAAGDGENLKGGKTCFFCAPTPGNMESSVRP